MGVLIGLGELCRHNFEHNRASSIQHNAGIIDNLKSIIIVQIVQTKACLEEESVN